MGKVKKLVGQSVGPSVCPSVSNTFFKNAEFRLKGDLTSINAPAQHTLFFSYKNHVYKNVEAQITLKFKNVVVILLVAISLFPRLKSKLDVLMRKKKCTTIT